MAAGDVAAARPSLRISSHLGDGQVAVPAVVNGSWDLSEDHARLRLSGSNPPGYTTTVMAVLDLAALSAAAPTEWICLKRSYVVNTTVGEYVGDIDQRVQWSTRASGWRTVVGTHEEYSATDLQTQAVDGIHHRVVTRVTAPVPTDRSSRYVLQIVLADEVDVLDDSYSIHPGACRGALKKA